MELGPTLQTFGSASATSPTDVNSLRNCGLVDSGGNLTNCGSILAYHWRAYKFQLKDTRIQRYAELARLDQGTSSDRVLDVGCGIGQTLAALPHRELNSLVGVDTNVHALAFGTRLAEIEGREVLFVAAPCHSLPFDGQSFSHVICHIALNYMHHRLSLPEMVRVLRPGGVLLLRVEGLGYDFELLTRQFSFCALHSRLYNLMLGVVGQLLDWEPHPSSRLSPGRIFSTHRRICQTLRKNGCDVKDHEIIRTYCKQPVAFSVLAERRTG